MTTEDRGPLSFDPDEKERAEWASEPADPAESERKPPPPPARPPGAFRYGWVVGVAFLIVVGLVTVNTLRTDSTTGSAGLDEGAPLPPFAMPLALSDLDGDANVARQPDQGQAGKRPACDVRGADILNVCQLAEQGPVVLAFFAARSGGACTRALDRLERARRANPGIRFAAVAIRGDRKDLRDEIRDRGWRFPVGYDHDGVVANLYGISVCPTVTFATPGGIVLRTAIGELDDAELAARLRELKRKSA